MSVGIIDDLQPMINPTLRSSPLPAINLDLNTTGTMVALDEGGTSPQVKVWDLPTALATAPLPVGSTRTLAAAPTNTYTVAAYTPPSTLTTSGQRQSPNTAATLRLNTADIGAGLVNSPYQLNGILYFAHTVFQDPARTAGRVHVITRSTGVDALTSLAPAASQSIFLPAVAPANDGSYLVGYQIASNTTFLSIGTRVKRAGVAALTAQVLFAGTATITFQDEFGAADNNDNINNDDQARMGDYTWAAPDPNGLDCWMFAEHGSTAAASAFDQASRILKYSNVSGP